MHAFLTFLAEAPIPVSPVTVGPGTYWTIAGSILTTLSAAVPLFLFVRKAARTWVADVANVKEFLVTPDGRPLGVVVQDTAKALDAMAASVQDLHHRADTTERRLDDHLRDSNAHRHGRRWA